jgi:magnesium-transporting ATPase (P-type)
LRNTDWIIGIVVYTGFETKIMKNSRSARTKLSRMETLVNRCIKLILLTQIALATVSMALGLFVNNVLENSLPWYLFPPGPVNTTASSQAELDETLLPEGLALWITFFILFNNVVPISLYVTVEMVNFMQAFYIDNDVEMYDPVTDTPALARTSSLNADLGQIEWIFSDKTGTLTCNEMKFRRCAISGKIYGKASDTGAFRSTRLAGLLRSKQSNLEKEFFTALAVCHTVVVEQESVEQEADADENMSNHKKQEHEQKAMKGATDGKKVSVYRAESPDEGALVDGAAAVGFTLIHRSGSEITIRDTTGALISYRVLAINAFNSTRKRMSMLVECPRSGKLLLLCKGADNVILERARVSANDSNMLAEQLSAFAGQGLRTLVIAQRVIPAQECKEWLTRFRLASESVDNRKALLADAAEAIEKELKILGITAIEDRLQDGVPDAINDLVRAGIKVWVLTGDKVETAINIGFSSKLLKRATTLIRITESGSTAAEIEEQLQGLCETFRALTDASNKGIMLRMVNRLNNTLFKMGKGVVRGLEDVGSGIRGMVRSIVRAPKGDKSTHQDSKAADVGGHGSTLTENHTHQRGSSGASSVASTSDGERDGQGELALVVTGEALEIILADAHLSHLLMDIGRVCDAVIACRVSPSQKANIVAMVHALAKPHDAEPPMTLAIGDGANDVGMIMEAQIGVGISGHEGLQAVNNSDFAIAQFRFLKRLLLVHGRWNYRRSAKVFLYSFYKNVVLVLTLFLYLPSSKISGQSLYEALVYAGYNFFLGWPIVGVGIFDQDISVATVLKYPELYISGRLNLDLRRRRMVEWVIMAIIHAGFIYYIPMFAFTRIYSRGNGETAWVDAPVQSDGETGGLYVLGTAIYVCLIFAMHWKVMWHTYSWTWVTALFMIGFSFPLFILFFVVYSNWLEFSPQFFGVSLQVFNNATLWLSAFLVLTCVAIIEYVKERIRMKFFPTAIDIAMELDRGFSTAKKRLTMLDYQTSEVDAGTPAQNSTAGGKTSLLVSSSSRSHQAHSRIWSNLVDADLILAEPPSPSHSKRPKRMSTEKRRQSHLEQAMSIEETRKTDLGLSIGRRLRESSYAFDHPTRELGRAAFESGNWSTMMDGQGRRRSRGRADSAHARSDSRNSISRSGFNGKPPLSSSNLRRSRSVESKQVRLSDGMSKDI